jgi:alpha-glucoside transport system substrate-binding protein
MSRSKLMPVFLVLAVAASAIVASTGYGGSAGQQARVGSAQDPITFLTLWGGSEKQAFEKVLRAFEAKTGLKVQNESGVRDFLPVIRTRIAAGNPPMLTIIPRPGILADLAREGALKELEPMGVSKSYLARNYSKAWIDLGTVDGKIYGFAAKANSKSVFWYSPADFKQRGFAVPTTWAQLVAVTKKYKAAGETPWALGAKDSWTLTDWFENVYVRTAGPDRYARLFGGTLPFDHPSVAAALRQMTSVLNDQYVAGGISGALGTAFVDGIGRVFGANPSAHLYMEGGFVGGIALGDVNPKLKPGRTIAEAPFPVINPRFGSPLVGGGDLTAVFVDNPEVRKLLLYLSSPEAGRIWVSTGAIVSPNKRVPQGAYPNVLVRAEAKQVAGATVFRFDGSDLLPGALGEDWGSALQKVIQKPSDIPKLLKDFQKKAAREFQR